MLDYLGESTNTLIEREGGREKYRRCWNSDFCSKSPKVENSKSKHRRLYRTSGTEQGEGRGGGKSSLLCLFGREFFFRDVWRKYRRRVGYRIARTSAFPLPLPSSRLLSHSLSLSIFPFQPNLVKLSSSFTSFVTLSCLLCILYKSPPPPSRPSPLTISSSDRLFFFSSRPIQPNPNLTDPLLPRTLSSLGP